MIFQRQLKGLPVAHEETVQVENYAFIDRVRVIQALFTFANPSLEEACRRRVEAINALTALCHLQKAQQPRRRRCNTSDVKLERDQTAPPFLNAPCLSDSLSIDCEPTQCRFCLGCESLPRETRLKPFHSRGDLKKHFYRKHLRHYPDGQPIACPHPRCHVDLVSKMHLRYHAELVHKTST